MTCLFATCQAPIQAALRPAVWIPGIKKLHSRRERWIIKMATPQEAFDDAVKALTKLEDKEFDGKVISLSKTDKNRLFVQCYCFSKIQWLDVVEISFHDSGNGTTLAKVYCFSSGALPLIIPPPIPLILNLALFFLPYWDNHFTKMWLEIIRRNMDLEIVPEHMV